MNFEQPLVTIITPSYNHGKYIRRAVESVFEQTYKNIEYIIIDDGSSDNSHEIIKELQKKYPSIQIILHRENRGHVRLNEGVNLAKGKYISFLSSDDWYLPEKIEKQVELFNKLDEDYGVVYSDGYRYYENKDELVLVNWKMRRGDILEYMLTEPSFIYPITPLIKKEALEKYPYSEGYRAEGEAIYFKIAMKYKFDFVSEPLVVMRDHDHNIGKDVYSMLIDNIRLREDLFAHPDLPEKMKIKKPGLLSKLYLRYGWDLVRVQKDYKLGKECFIRAFRNNAWIFLNKRWIVGYCLSILRK